MHQFEIFGIHFLEIFFLVGLLGSTVVVAISFVEDFGELFSSDKSSEEPLVPHPPRT
jgi:hypothetical protein